jgi:tRNA1(Val) A37 N6-methylase TrmN6
MKNLSFGHFEGLCTNNTAGVHLAKEKHRTTRQHHDSIIIAKRVVKEHGESLLIILPEATFRHAEQGNTIPPAITRVFPVPYRSSKKVLHVIYSKSYQMSAS